MFLSFPEHCKDIKWFAKYIVVKACCCFSLIVYFMFIWLGKQTVPTELPTFHYRKRPQHTLFIFWRRSHKASSVATYKDRKKKKQKQNLALNFLKDSLKTVHSKGCSPKQNNYKAILCHNNNNNLIVQTPVNIAQQFHFLQSLSQCNPAENELSRTHLKQWQPFPKNFLQTQTIYCTAATQDLSWQNVPCTGAGFWREEQNADCPSSLVFHYNSKTLCWAWGGMGTSSVCAQLISLSYCFPSSLIMSGHYKSMKEKMESNWNQWKTLMNMQSY